MKNKKFDAIVVLNVHYPFERLDPFWDNEIPYMKKYAKEILFLPLGVKDYGNWVEDDSITAVKGLRQTWRTRWATDLGALFRASFWEECTRWGRESKDLISLGKILDYNAQFNRFGRIILNFLSAHISPDANVLFYSYWLGMCSHLAGYLHNNYCNSIAISRAHGGDIYGKEQGMDYVAYRKESVQDIDAVFSVSKMGENYLKYEFQEMGGCIFCSRLGTEDWGRNLLDLEAPFTIVSCSNLIPLKRVHLLIEALALFDKEVCWIHFGDGPLRIILEKQARETLPEFVHWEFRGYLHPDELMEEYRKLSINLFINVSSSEGIPVSIMEALSFGIPVMATDVGGTKEAVFDGYNGKLLPADISADNLAQAIMSFRDELEIHGDQYRKHARDSWDKNYNAEKNYTHFYESLCALYEKNTGCSL